MVHDRSRREQASAQREPDDVRDDARLMGRTGMRPANLVRYRVEIHTLTLRAYGTLHTRAGVSMTRILNSGDRPHLSLTDAHLHASGVEQPPAPETRLYSTGFAAIPRDAIMWLIGGQAEVHQPSLRLEPRETYLIYPAFVLAGAIHMRPELRFSDAIGTAMVNRPFITLSGARVLDRREADTPIVELPTLRELEHVTVDLRKATAIVDREGGIAPRVALNDAADTADPGDALIDDPDIDVPESGDLEAT